MSAIPAATWIDDNQAALNAALSEVRVALAQHLSCSDELSTADNKPSVPLAPAEASSPGAEITALDQLCAAFSLSSFERKVLLMSAGAELDSRFAALYASAYKGARIFYPTFSLALSAFNDAHWSALLPTRPLRYWHLLEIIPGDGLTTSPLRIDERILHFLAGMSSIDERIRGVTEVVIGHGILSSSQSALAEKIADAWYRADWQNGGPVLELCGSDGSSKRSIAATACSRLGIGLRVLRSNSIPRNTAELDFFVRLWQREVTLNPTALFLDCDEANSSDSAAEVALQRLLQTLCCPLLLSVRERCRWNDGLLFSFQVPRPTFAEQQQIWKEELGPSAHHLNGDLDWLAAQFSFNACDIRAAVSCVLSSEEYRAGGIAEHESQTRSAGEAPHLAVALWDVCRAQARPRLESLAQRIEPVATWDDLVLPERQKEILVHIAVHLRQRSKVYQSWGFAAKSARGLGISALFAGPSGTGKTMSAEVLANELRLDLYRIDLSQVVSKYIGETEKNLRRVFDAAEDGAAILLFDEADALFGKRSEVKDSHDRYANIEVSYLLQRMEAYRGLAILTTNRKETLDAAFLRRIRFVVDFPFPNAAERAEIWRRVFPPQTPTEGLCIERLTRLNAAGGHIRNIAMTAAFQAADAGEPVRMSHLLWAARHEFAKLERPLSGSEIAGWV